MTRFFITIKILGMTMTRFFITIKILGMTRFFYSADIFPSYENNHFVQADGGRKIFADGGRIYLPSLLRRNLEYTDSF